MAVIINVDGSAIGKGDGACPHLRFEGNKAICAVHDEPWYKGSPCDVYGNPDFDPDFECKRGRPCSVGKMIQERGGLPEERRKPISAENLTYLGPWLTEEA